MAGLSATAISLVSLFRENIIATYKNIKDELNQALDDGLGAYIGNQYEKYINAKTFLFREDNINFHDIYFPVGIKTKHKILNLTDNTKDLFKSSNYASIIGSAGSGKTMLTKNIFLDFLRTSIKIPIIVELRHLNSYNGDLTNYIKDHIFDNKLSKNKKILERLLDEGTFLILLDGYDEIFSDKKSQITHGIEEFVDKYYQNYFVLTSRPDTDIETLPRFEVYNVCPLNTKQIKAFINKQLVETNIDPELAAKIIQTIDKEENKDYESFLSSPLLLSMFILTYGTYPELPKTKSKFYWNVFDTLCIKHDSINKRGGFIHERKSKLQTEDFEKILKLFSYHTLFKGKYDFDANDLFELLNQIKTKLGYQCDTNDLIFDLTVSINILIKDGLFYKFPHRSLQEYFCASLIKDLREDKKKEIYQKQFPIFFSSSLDRSQNLWSLCFELDKIDFTRLFILFNLKSFLNSKEKLPPEKRGLALLKEFEYDLKFRLENEDFASFGYMRNILIIFDICSFMNIKYYDRSTILNVIKKKKDIFIQTIRKNENLFDKISDEFSINLYPTPPSNSYHNQIIEKLKFIDSVNEWFDYLKIEYLKLKEVIDKEEQKLSLLLDLD